MSPNVQLEAYGSVTIYQTSQNHYFYALSDAVLSTRRGIDLLNVLLEDDRLEEVMYIGPRRPIKVAHRKYGMCNTNVHLAADEAISIIYEVAQLAGREISEGKPLLDAALPDGSRFNATIPPVSVDGPTMTIRKFKKDMITITDLVRNNTMTAEVAAFLWCCVEGLGVKPANIIFAGGTGSGKTTNLNAVTMFIPYDARIITIEDTAELQLRHEHVVRMQAAMDAKIGIDDLLRNALRMRPDRILVGEVRGQEANTLFTAMNTGHEGSMGTLHANTTKETLTRITNPPMNVPAIMLQGLDLIVMQQRIISGKRHSRHITEISEISGAGEKLPRFNTLFLFDPSKEAVQKTGVPSQLRERISSAAGIRPRDFDDLIKKRHALIEQAVRENVPPDALMVFLNQNMY